MGQSVLRAFTSAEYILLVNGYDNGVISPTGIRLPQQHSNRRVFWSVDIVKDKVSYEKMILEEKESDFGIWKWGVEIRRIGLREKEDISSVVAKFRSGKYSLMVITESKVKELGLCQSAGRR